MLRIAHRGASGYEPENTLRSFKKALALKANMIELDVHLTKDKKLVVIHDETLDRTTNGKGKVADFTLKEIKKLTIKKKEKIPTLEEVFNLVNKKAKINIELKGKNTAEPVSKLINRYVKNGWTYDYFLVSSFNYRELKKLNRINPKIRIGLVFERFTALNLRRAKKIKAYSIHPLSKLIGLQLIHQAHQNNLKVFAWVVDDNKNSPLGAICGLKPAVLRPSPLQASFWDRRLRTKVRGFKPAVSYKKEIEKLKQLKVDGIFSNYPDRI